MYMNRKQSNRLARNASNAEIGFSLIEMIGVLAIIAVLAAVALPKVFSAITSSRVNGTMMGVNSIKAATTDFVAKYGTLPRTNNKSRIDDLLVTAGLLDQRFSAKIGVQGDSYAVPGATWAFDKTAGAWKATGGSNQNKQTRVVSALSNKTDPATARGRNFQFDGSTPLPAGSRVVSAILRRVPAAEALELSQKFDGPGSSGADTTEADGKGKVVYNTPHAKTGLTDVYVYVAHQ